jgi:hypothetical protein
MNPGQRALLWFDGGAGAIVGTLVLVFREWLAVLQGFPLGLVLFMGLANLAYASYSTTLAARATSGRTPSRRSIARLVAANGGWALVCAVIVVSTWPFATPLGRALVTFEGLFVGSLAFVEYRLLLKHSR